MSRVERGGATCASRAARAAPRGGPRRRLRIVMCGMIGGVPGHGGATWAVLQYLLGLRRLGHEVYFVEPVARSAILPLNARLEDSLNAAYFRHVVEAFDLERTSALLLSGTDESVGLSYADLRRIAARTDLLVNISGMLADEALLEPIPRRAYLDLDPGFNQLWSAVQGVEMRFDAHDLFVTIGLSIGSPGTAIPTCGRRWIPTLQPIVLERWPVAGPIEHDALTTVGNWRGYGSIENEGVHYGQKAHSLRRFMDLPTRTPERFRLALSIHPDERSDLEALARNDWELADPGLLAGSPGAFQRFVQGSKAEFGIAKSGYVSADCGWFSDRSVCYLASGRPVLAQETGFSRYLPVGDGLLSFSTTDEALAGIDAMRCDYGRHARAARALAEHYFDSDVVLPRLLDALGVGC